MLNPKSSQAICLLCEDPLTESNDSAEHILPNSIGGWETVRGFICEPCNSKKGRTWDAELGKQFAWLSLVCGIKRDRGQLPSVDVKTLSGKEYRLLPNGSMQPKDFAFRRDDNGEQISISFTARSLAEVRTKFKELKKKYPKFDVEKAMEGAKMTSSHLDEPLVGSLPEGGGAVGRSIIMTALAVGLKVGISPHKCELVLPFLRNADAPSDCYGWSFLTDAVVDRKADEISHCVSLFGNPCTGKLYAYVELFSYGRWHIALSEKYDGTAIEYTYAIDPSLGKEVGKKIDWKNPLRRIDEVIAGDGYNQENVLTAANHLMEVVMVRSRERNFNTAFTSAVDKVKKEMGLQYAPSDHLVPPGFVEKVMEEMKPYILHRLGQNYLPKADGNNFSPMTI